MPISLAHSVSIASRIASRIALLFVLACLGVNSASSQVAGTPGPPLPIPDQSNVRHDAALNPALPTIFIVGDSTARNGADLGWGDHFAHYFDTAKVNVANRAIAGRSAIAIYPCPWRPAAGADRARRAARCPLVRVHR